jgi:hypothetical protein
MSTLTEVLETVEVTGEIPKKTVKAKPAPAAAQPEEILSPAARARRDEKLKEEAFREKYSRLVRGRFRFYESPGGTLKFNLGQMFKGDPVKKWIFKDGEVREIPYGVARHLIDNGWYPVHTFAQDENGNPNMRIGEKIQRFGFEPLDFIDVEGRPLQELVTVERVGY